MSKILVLVGMAFAAAAVFVLVRAAMLPDDFRVSRSTIIKAPREKVFAFINDMKSFNQWNPFAKMDPSTKTVYRGPASGPSAAFDFRQTATRRTFPGQ